jgi:ABC-2 type transport system ATP-binding protein
MTLPIRLEKLTKSYGRQIALQQVSLEVPAGGVFALLGENGAGKSTAIKLMLGLQEADSGSVEVLGLNSAKHGEAIRRWVGYVAERPTLYEWMTVAEIGWFTSGFYPAGYEAGYQQLIAQFRLPAQKKISELSKGMRAKVSLALAMAHNPELLILDEPTSGLDTLVRREFLESMVDRAANGQTVFLSSHQISEVERVADWVAILREGELVVVERLEKLKQEMHELTLTLLDSQPEPPLVRGELFRQRRRARQWQLLVRSSDEHWNRELREHPTVAEVEVRTPSLEEIFVAYMQRASSTEASPSSLATVQ